MDHQATRCCRTDCAQQLSRHQPDLYSPFQWLRPGFVCEVAVLSAVFCCGWSLVFQSHREHTLAEVFSFWPDGMAVAITDVLEAPAHSSLTCPGARGDRHG